MMAITTWSWPLTKMVLVWNREDARRPKRSTVTTETTWPLRIVTVRRSPVASGTVVTPLATSGIVPTVRPFRTIAAPGANVGATTGATFLGWVARAGLACRAAVITHTHIRKRFMRYSSFGDERFGTLGTCVPNANAVPAKTTCCKDVLQPFKE